MRHAILPFALATAIAAPTTAQDPAATPPPADYVVHEWGTFTCMADGRGIALEGLQHEEEALPEFVHDLLKIEPTASTHTKLPASYVTQKMETPVLYFYADHALQVRVDVTFDQGLMTQFYPLPTTIYPELDDARAQRVDLRRYDESTLRWDIDVLPRTEPLPREIPKVAADDPWAFARQTDANCVRTRQVEKSQAAPEAEHYLFYRGLGRWQPAVRTECTRGGHLAFKNDMAAGIPFCMAFELGEHGGRCAVHGALATGETAAFDLGAAAWSADREHFARTVGAFVLKALVDQGLYVPEARAMVATWSRSWFQKDGTRVLYLLPRQFVDQVLPLRLEPQPKELVRVLVGRHECITPEAQDEVERALRAGDEPALAHLDRFLEPHLRNVVANGRTPAVRTAAAARLAALPR